MLGTSCCVFAVAQPFQSQLRCYFRITLCGDRGRALYHSHFVCPCIGPEVIAWVCHGDERISCWEIPSISRLVILTIVVKFHVLLLECGNSEGTDYFDACFLGILVDGCILMIHTGLANKQEHVGYKAVFRRMMLAGEKHQPRNHGAYPFQYSFSVGF